MTIKRKSFLPLLLFLAFCSLIFSLKSGSLAINTQQIFSALSSHATDPTIQQIILTLRLPRALSAFVTGGLLALAGALIQALLRNPLADPYVLGISSGAAVLALLCILLGFSGHWLTSAAWIGSLLTILLVFFIARKNSQHLLLTGIAIASGFSALISLILIMASNSALHSMMFWLLGDLSNAHMPFFETGVLVTGVVVSFFLARQLNIFVHGEKQAQAIGVNSRRLQITLYFLSSLLTATAVTLAGCIGFVGLIVPHFFRLLGFYDYRLLIPGSVLLGGSLLVVADTLGRTIILPQQLPAGMMMSFIGIPVFLVLLRR